MQTWQHAGLKSTPTYAVLKADFLRATYPGIAFAAPSPRTSIEGQIRM